MSNRNRRERKMIPAVTPLTPASICDTPSPLDTLRSENAALTAEVAQLRKMNQVKFDSRVLDLELRQRNYKKYIRDSGLTADFQSKFYHD